MPELPEVETVRRSLLPLVGERLEKTFVHDGRLRYRVNERKLRKLIGQRVRMVSRYGKCLLIRLQSDTLLFHLGMTGRLIINQKRTSPYLKVRFHFGKVILDFIDVRRFGFVLSGEAAENAVPRGEDAWLKRDLSGLFPKIRRSNAEIKSLILNQELIAGLGNIYASEILFRAKVHPQRRGNSLSVGEWRRICKSIPAILKRAIESKGSSISDFVYSLPGESEYSTGNYQKNFLVYNRESLACTVCRTEIRKIVQSGRSSFFCPSCQK